MKLPPFGDRVSAPVKIALWIAVACLVANLSSVAGQDTIAGQPNKDVRDRWVKQYGAKGLKGRFYKRQAPDQQSIEEFGDIKVVVTAVGGDTDDIENDFRLESYHYGCKVSADWHISSFYHGERGSKGGGGSQVPEEDRQRLNDLLADLPPEATKLPPNGRRVMIQVSKGDRFVSHIYDRADAPDIVLEVLRLTGSEIRASLPTFKPQYDWKVGAYGEGVFRFTPDGKSIIAQDRCYPIKFWDPYTKQQLKELPFGKWICPSGMAFSPDGEFAVFSGAATCAVFSTATWEEVRTFEETTIGNSSYTFHSPRFTPDGQYLLLENGHSLGVFSTKDWQRCDPPNYLPGGAFAYFPASQSKRAVIRTKSKAVALWDVDQRLEYATLDENAAVMAVAFSSDESLVAVATMGDNWRRGSLRIWDVVTGKLIHELRPYERRTGSIVGLAWTPDNRYLLGTSNSDTSYGIGIWNAATGRHRGHLTGSVQSNGFAFFDQHRKVAEGSRDGKVRVWDFEAVRKDIEEFEKSLIGRSH